MSEPLQYTHICTTSACDRQHDWIIPAQDGSQFLAHSTHLKDNMLQEGPYGFDLDHIHIQLQQITQDLEKEEPRLVELLIEVCHPRSDSVDWIYDIPLFRMKKMSRYGITYKMYNVLELCMNYFARYFKYEPLFTFGFAIKLEDYDFANRVAPLTLGLKPSEIQESLGGPGKYNSYFIVWNRYNDAAKEIIKRSTPPKATAHPNLKKRKMKKLNRALILIIGRSPRYLFNEGWKEMAMKFLRLKLNGCFGCLRAYDTWLTGMMKEILELPPLEKMKPQMKSLELGVESLNRKVGRKALAGTGRWRRYHH